MWVGGCACVDERARIFFAELPFAVACFVVLVVAVVA